MKKVLLRLVLPILAVALLVGAIVGVHSLADSPTPYIYSKNVTYGSYIVMNYAIPVESVPSGQTVGLGIYASASATEPKEIVTAFSVQTLFKGTQYEKECYVFQTHGVAAKNINTYEYVRPVTSDGVGHGDAIKYSVEDYLYQRLYTDGYALMTEGDGDDFNRRNLYYDTLWYGASAQKLLLADQLAAGKVAPIGRSTSYFGALYSSGSSSQGSATLTFDGTSFPFLSFDGTWTVKTFDVFGNELSSRKVNNNESITFEDGIVTARPDFSVSLNGTDTAIYSGSKVHISYEGVGKSDLFLLVNSLKKIVGVHGTVTYSYYTNESAHTNIVFEFVDDPIRSQPTTAAHPNKADNSSIFEYAHYEISADSGVITVRCDANPYSTMNASSAAIEDLVTKLVPKNGIAGFTAGDITEGVDNLINRQRAIDNANIELQWSRVLDSYGDADTIEALRYFFENMTNETIVRWCASLFDPATGMFYSSSSGKNTAGYYPHPEATSQVTGYPMSTYMVDGTTPLPQIVKYQIIYYLKSIQASDGQFYVAQMSNPGTERVGRDRSACITLLSRCGGRPTYTNGSTEGDGIDAETYWATLVAEGKVTEDEKPIIYWASDRVPEESSPATVSISRSTVTAVSKAVGYSEVSSASSVVAAASATDPFQTHKAFITWLCGKDAWNGPYGAISNTSSAASMIDQYSSKNGGYLADQIAADYPNNYYINDNGEFCVDITGLNAPRSFTVTEGDTLNIIQIKWLNSYLNDAGLFGKITNNYQNGEPVYDGHFGGWGYQNSNGFMKCIGRYSSSGLAFPMPWEAAESLLKGINSPEVPQGNILVMYNVWSSLSGLKSNITKYYQGDDKQELLNFIDETLRAKVNYVTGEAIDVSYAALAIMSNYEKSQAFRKSDGGFGHSTTNGTPSWQGGLPVGVASDNLSDTDGTFCGITSLGSSIRGALGIGTVPIHTEADFMIWMDTLLKQPYVIKKTPSELEASSGAEEGKAYETFEGITEEDALKYIGSGINSDNKVSLTEKGGSNVLYIDKNSTSTGINVQSSVMLNQSNAKVFTFEFDMLIESAPSGIGNEIYLLKGSTKVYYILMRVSGSTLYVYENGGNGKATTATVGSWANFKFIYHEDSANYDVYVNGAFVFTGSTLRDVTEAPKVSELTGARMWFGQSYRVDCYLDNISVRRTTEPVVTFNDGVIPEVITGASGNVTTHTIVDRGNGDKALHMVKSSNLSYGGSFGARLTDVAEVDANTFIFECDMYVTKFTQMAIYITTPEKLTSGNEYYTNICSSSANAVTYGTATAPVGEWIHFKLVYYKYSETQGHTTITITSSAGTKSKTYINTDTIDLDKANMILFNCQTATIHDVKYDNVSCKKVYVAR